MRSGKRSVRHRLYSGCRNFIAGDRRTGGKYVPSTMGDGAESPEKKFRRVDIDPPVLMRNHTGGGKAVRFATNEKLSVVRCSQLRTAASCTVESAFDQVRDNQGLVL